MKKGLERKPPEFIEGIGTKTSARDLTMINKFSIHPWSFATLEISPRYLLHSCLDFHQIKYLHRVLFLNRY